MMHYVEIIPINNLHPHPDNPRKDLGDLTELAESIKVNGVLQNLIVSPRWSKEKNCLDGYRIIVGHRRHAAAKLAGLEDLPCIVACMTPQEEFRAMMMENVQRENLTAYEEAEGFQTMLDMGESVKQVAQTTGFSETTIRRRAKLLDLDREKFHKAAERGATMTDYLKLNEIKDPVLRNTVLDTIGTPDFNQTFRAAMTQQKNMEWLQTIIESLRDADWCEEITAQQRDDMKDVLVTFQYNYNPHNKREFTKPGDTGKLKWFFFVGREQVDMYRQIDPNKKEKPDTSIADQKRLEVAAKIDDLMAECEEQEQEFRGLRESFITEFDQWNTYREEILAFAVKAWLHRDVSSYEYSSKVDREELAGLLGIEYDTKANKLDEKALEQRLRVNPEQVLLCVAYLLLEDGKRGWSIKCYENVVKTSRPIHRNDKQLELLYDCLRSLGYDWSTEEQRAFGGLLPQYQLAKRLIEEYEEERHG
ncbi:MAG: ParB/RepB/Spo0J family partition protein [Oscillospiraceae bacterium]|nr:ParB/RepB/Spo0J family partition protein [Oscillospiraceae bacterium]